MRFEPCPILNRFCDTLGEIGNKLFTIGVFEYLGSVFGNDPGDINIEYLTGLKAHVPVLAGRQFASVNIVPT